MKNWNMSPKTGDYWCRDEKKDRVVRKYSFLVQVENLHSRPGDGKIKTITYPELVMERRKNHV
nr:MAG TPA: hypothetical protein [Caudoviricetes sp.]